MQKHIPSTAAEYLQNISPLSGKMTLIPNKAGGSAENMQKLNHKSASSKNLGEVKVLATQDGLLQTQIEISSNIKKMESPSTALSRRGIKVPIVKAVTKFVDDSLNLQNLFEKKTNASAKSITEDEKSSKQLNNYRTILPKCLKVPNNDSVESATQFSKPSVILDGDDIKSHKKIVILNANDQTQKFLIIRKNKSTQQQDLTENMQLKNIDGKKLIVMKNRSILSPKCIIVDENSGKIVLEKSKTTSRDLKRSMVPDSYLERSNNKKLCLDVSNKKSSSEYCVELTSDEDENNQSLHVKNNASYIPKGNIVIKKVFKGTSYIKNNTDFEENNSVNLVESTVSNDSDKLNSSSDKIDFLKKALLSVEDEKLREQALKALHECGVKVKKSVPLKRPYPGKLIKESTTQTDVFCLLEKGQFINVDEKQGGLLRMENKNGAKKFDEFRKPGYESFNEHKLQLDKMLDSFDNKNIQDIKIALEKKHSDKLAKILLKQLNTEFERTTNYDKDGLLGIHRAVLNNDFHQVQKNLIILKACKLSVDINSQDCKTSLELAVKHEVNPQIIKILLDAGAEPVSLKSRHDTALILASKNSSKILSLLIKNINESNKSLVNAKDSEGLAAIHYCAENGNLEGVSELVSLGVNVNLQDDRSGRTALFYAVECRNDEVPQETYNEIAHKLLENGAISDIPIFSKQSVLSMLDNVKSHTLKIAINRAVS